MGFVLYNGEHSINFTVYSMYNGEIIDTVSVNTWDDLHLIPVSRPSIAIPEPRVNIIQLPLLKANVDIYKEGLFFDATDYLGPLIFGNRTGEWNFVIDHEKWSSWDDALRYISELLNGVKVSVQLTDDTSRIYEGYLTVSGYSSDGAYSSIAIKYDLNAKHSKSNTPFYHIRFLDNDGSLIQASYVERNSLPVCKTTPKKERKRFLNWSPSIVPANNDANYTAIYQTIIYYRINFVNYDGTVVKSSLVEQGETPSCGTIPVRSGYIFVGWSPSITPANSNKTYTATFIEPYRVLSDTWEEINSNILDMTYRTKYKVGDMVPLSISGYYSDYAQIAAIDTDFDSNNNRIPITWILYKTCPQKYNKSIISSAPAFYSRFPQIVQNMIVAAKKYTLMQNGDSSSFSSYTAYEYFTIWVPSYREVFGGVDYENNGVSYTSLFLGSKVRQKIADSGYPDTVSWWLRTSSKVYFGNFLFVDSNGEVADEGYTNNRLVLGFCTKGYSG